MTHLRLDERVPLSKLQIIEEQSSPLQRKAKIYSRKLPQDFFSQRNISNGPLTRNNVHTQGLPRRTSNIERGNISPRKGALTARLDADDEAMSLLRGVIATSREMRKMIRRHSL